MELEEECDEDCGEPGITREELVDVITGLRNTTEHNQYVMGFHRKHLALKESTILRPTRVANGKMAKRFSEDYNGSTTK